MKNAIRKAQKEKDEVVADLKRKLSELSEELHKDIAAKDEEIKMW